MLRRIASAVALIALVSAPVAARERLFCRYTGVEIEGCAEAQPANTECSVGLAEGCCERQIVRPLSAMRTPAHEPLSTPTAPALAAAAPPAFAPARALAARPGGGAPQFGPLVFLRTRALLL